MMSASLEYIDENNNQVSVIQKNEENLSPISLSILDSVLNKNITIIFSQGPLNLASIISSRFALQKQQDVLIGIPQRLFHERFEKNTKIFFSLIYRTEIGSGKSSSLYFYRNMLWCKGEISEETNELVKLDISTRPKHGTLKYKSNYDKYAKDSLTSGTFQTMPKIVSIPIEELTPAGIIGEKPINFENYTYTLKNFDPKLVIYDSINERKYCFDNIFELINKAEKKDIKLLLHFSWPYLKGLSTFLNKIKDNTNISVIHLGKRFCIESQKNFVKPTPNILPLSLEGDFWEIYYPKRRFFDFKIILPPPEANSKNLSANDIVNWDWHFDERITEIREHLRYEPISKFKENLLRFPPVVDTFLCPSEIKIGTTLMDNSWASIPIDEFFSIKENESSCSIRAFKGLCSDLERCRDLSYEFKGLYTNSAVTKKTLFQAFFIEKINNQFRGCIQKNLSDSDSEASTSILIANFHPYLKTQKSLAESLIYLFKSIDYALNFLKLPDIQKKEKSIYIEKELYNGEKLKEILWETNSTQESNINNIKRLFSNSNPEVNVWISKKNNQLELTLGLNLSFDYLEFRKQNSTLDRQYFKGLIFYEVFIKNNGSFNEYKLSSISFDRRLKNSVVKMRIEHKSDTSPKKIIEKEITTVYTDFSNMQALSQELIKNSDLIIPGSIPFTTISEGDILIYHGYDALLLPFKNVIFFAYPGNNFKYILKQTKLYNDLLSENQTNISKRDLLFSIDNTKDITRFNLPPKPESNNIQIEEHEIDTPIDTAIREELLNDSNLDENEREEIKTLKKIWDEIKEKTVKPISPPPLKSPQSKEHIHFCVEFESGAREVLSFPVGTLIRKKRGEDYILSPIDEISENDRIIYIQTDERESIENYLLKTLEDEMSLEEILEPLLSLKSFYETLNSLDFKMDYDETKLKKLGWLSSEQKENLFYLFRVLLYKDPLKLQEVSIYLSNSIWKELIKPETLIEIFGEAYKKITYSKLYDLAVKMGLNYKENSFKMLCSTAINDQKHYYFLDENNLFAIGQLIGHQGIIENYQIINEKGTKIRTFLQLVGFSIKRVTNDEGEPLNDMDNAIEVKLKKCKVVKMGGC